MSVLDTTFSELCVDIEDQRLSEDILQSQPKRIFDIAVIRKLLIDALDNDDLNDLCYDYFPDVYKEFSEGMGNRKRRRLLIDYCERRNQLEKLLDHIRSLNPEKYNEYFPHLIRKVSL